jgi:predicted MFS family arabinose efflux permease
VDHTGGTGDVDVPLRHDRDPADRSPATDRRWPRRRLLGAVLLIATVATAVSALAPSYPILMAGRIAAALSQALFWAIVTPAAAALFAPAVRGRAISILYAGSSTAPLLGVPGGTWLGQQTGWRTPFLALAALSLGAAVLIVALMPDLPPGSSDADRGSAPDAGRYRSLILTTAITVGGAFTAFTCVTPFLTGVSGLDDAAIGPILLVRGVAGLLGAILTGFLVRRHAWRTMVVLIGVQVVAMVVQRLWGGSAVTTTAAVAIGGMVLSGLTVVLGARVLEVAPGDTDLASAGMSTAFNVGITGGALLGSYLLTATTVRESASLAAVISVVGLIVALVEPRMATARRKGGARPPALPPADGDRRAVRPAVGAGTL